MVVVVGVMGLVPKWKNGAGKKGPDFFQPILRRICLEEETPS